MKPLFSRRDFLRAGGAMTALAATVPFAFAANETPAPIKRGFKKAIMWAHGRREGFGAGKDAGGEGGGL
jgi:hypothetical protein